MGERAVKETAERLKKGEDIKSISGIRGTVTRMSGKPDIKGAVFLNSYEDINKDKKLFSDNFKTAYLNTDPFSAKTLIEQTGEQYVIQNPPQFPLSTGEMDKVYSYPLYGGAPSFIQTGRNPGI